MISIYYPPYAFGGDAIYVYRLAKELVERGARKLSCLIDVGF